MVVDLLALNTVPYLSGMFVFAILLLIIHGFALWKAAKLNDTIWFILLFALSLGGFLSIIYLIIKRNKKT